jgi:hypothetical protein
VDLSEVLCSLALLCHGSESAKQRFVFELLDADADGQLVLAEVFRFLYSFSAVLAVLRCPNLEAMSSTEEDEEQRAAVWQDAEQMLEAAEFLHEQADEHDEQTLSFAQCVVVSILHFHVSGSSTPTGLSCLISGFVAGQIIPLVCLKRCRAR